MISDSAKLALAEQFLLGLRTADLAVFQSILAEEAIWSMPGVSTISGHAMGALAIHQRARLIVSRGMRFNLKHLLVGRHGVTASLHNTVQDTMFDMHLATVLTMANGRIQALDTYMADVDLLNRFFDPFALPLSAERQQEVAS